MMKIWFSRIKNLFLIGNLFVLVGCFGASGFKPDVDLLFVTEFVEEIKRAKFIENVDFNSVSTALGLDNQYAETIKLLFTKMADPKISQDIMANRICCLNTLLDYQYYLLRGVFGLCVVSLLANMYFVLFRKSNKD